MTLEEHLEELRRPRRAEVSAADHIASLRDPNVEFCQSEGRKAAAASVAKYLRYAPLGDAFVAAWAASNIVALASADAVMIAKGISAAGLVAFHQGFVEALIAGIAGGHESGRSAIGLRSEPLEGAQRCAPSLTRRLQ